MPAHSKAQLGKLFALEARGELKKGTAEKFASETPNIKRLPMHVKHKYRGGLAYQSERDHRGRADMENEPMHRNYSLGGVPEEWEKVVPFRHGEVEHEEIEEPSETTSREPHEPLKAAHGGSMIECPKCGHSFKAMWLGGEAEEQHGHPIEAFHLNVKNPENAETKHQFEFANALRRSRR